MKCYDGRWLLQRGEVAAMFGVDPKVIQRWAEQGRLPSGRTPGGHIRIWEDEAYAVLLADRAQAEK